MKDSMRPGEAFQAWFDRHEWVQCLRPFQCAQYKRKLRAAFDKGREYERTQPELKRSVRSARWDGAAL